MIRNKKVLITGIAGFIGFHLAKKLQKEGLDVYGLDNINDYYDPELKLARLKELGIYTNQIVYNQEIKGEITFIKLDLQDLENMKVLFSRCHFDFVVNLAAQAGVGYSLENPQSYIDSNITGFLNVLECCRAFPVEHLVFASSSSIYGLSEAIPFHEDDSADHPMAIYAASKKANEMMAHSYAHLFNIPCTGLRFFTVYGPWGRPDMAYYIFTKAILEDKEFNVYNNGKMSRDFTYVDDIVESIKRLLPKPPRKNHPEFNVKSPTPSKSTAAYQIFNIGNNSPVGLMEFVHAIEKALNKKGKINYQPMKPGDVPSTYANVESLFNYIDFKPETKVVDGINAFVEFYKKHHLK